MQPHETISAALKGARAEGRTGLVPFITAGYPDPAGFADMLVAVSRVGDVVEIGVPFSDPMADGMTIQRSSHAAIEQGVSLGWIFDQLEAVKDRVEAPLVLMSYMNPLLAFGYKRLAEHAARTAVGGFIVPDLPLEESDELRETLEAKGVGVIQLVTPATPEARVKRLAAASRGFLYAVTIRGVTGGSAGLPDDLANYLDRVSELSPLPVCAGFGIRSADDVRNVGGHATGAIVGSALVEVLERGEDPAAFLESLAA
jgi:tryptophan synthase alpha chain